MRIGIDVGGTKIERRLAKSTAVFHHFKQPQLFA